MGPRTDVRLLASAAYGNYMATTREHFAEVAISTRDNAIRRPTAIMTEPLNAGGET